MLLGHIGSTYSKKNIHHNLHRFCCIWQHSDNFSHVISLTSDFMNEETIKKLNN